MQHKSAKLTEPYERVAGLAELYILQIFRLCNCFDQRSTEVPSKATLESCFECPIVTQKYRKMGICFYGLFFNKVMYILQIFRLCNCVDQQSTDVPSKATLESCFECPIATQKYRKMGICFYGLFFNKVNTGDRVKGVSFIHIKGAMSHLHRQKIHFPNCPYIYKRHLFSVHCIF